VPGALLDPTCQHREAAGIGEDGRLDGARRQRPDEPLRLGQMGEDAVALADVPRALGKPALRVRRSLGVACSLQQVRRLAERFVGVETERLTDSAETDEDAPALGPVVRHELERGSVEPRGGLVAVERAGAITGVAESLGRAGGEIVDVEACDSPELEGLEVVVREHLRVVLLAAQALDPAGREAVLPRPVRTRHLAVGDVADEQVAERVLELAGDRGRAVAADELLPLELVQAPLELALLAAGERGERPGPERLADD